MARSQLKRGTASLRSQSKSQPKRATRVASALMVGLRDGVKAPVALRVGLLSSIVAVVASWGVGIMPAVQGSSFARAAFLVPLRVDSIGVIACAVALVLGVVALFWSWLQLGRYSLGEGGVGLGRKALLLWGAPWLLGFPVLSQDVFSYAAQGRLLLIGKDPYHDWVSQMPGWFAQGADGLWAQSTSPYGPLFILASAGVYAISGGLPETNILLFKLLAIGGVWLCAITLPRLARKLGRDPGWAVWITLTNPLFVLSMIASAHNDGVMVGLLLAACLMALRRKVVVAALLVGAAIAVKPIVILALPALGLLAAGRGASWGRRFSRWAIIGAVVGGMLTLLGAVSGLWFGWIAAMADQGGAAFPFAPFGLLGLGIGTLVGAVLGSAAGAAVQGAIYALGKLIAVASAFYLALRKPNVNPVWQAGVVLLLAVVLNPVIQPWYLFWFLPLLAASSRLYGFWERLIIILSIAVALWCLVDQLSIPAWVAPAPLKWSCVGIGVLASVALLVLPRSTRGAFELGKASSWFSAQDRSVVAPR